MADKKEPKTPLYIYCIGSREEIKTIKTSADGKDGAKITHIHTDIGKINRMEELKRTAGMFGGRMILRLIEVLYPEDWKIMLEHYKEE